MSRSLSMVEEAIWIECNSERGSQSYNIPYLVELQEEMDPAVLTAAFGDLVRAHPALRTGYRWNKGEAVAQAHDKAEPDVEFVDLRGVPDAEAQCRRRVAAAIGSAMDLAEPPLMRVLHVRTRAESGGVLCVVLHHLIADGRSREVLFADLSAFTAERLAGREPSIGERDQDAYAQWGLLGRRRAQEDDTGRQFWSRRLMAADPGGLNRLVGNGREHTRRHRRVERITGGDLVEIRRTAARHRWTLNTLLASALSISFSRLTAARDVCLGVVSGNRGPQVADVVGAFAATVPALIRVRPDSTFEEHTRAVSQEMRELSARPAVPLHALAGEGRVPDEWRRAFDVLFVHTFMPERLLLGDVPVRPLDGEPPGGRSPITVTAQESKHELVLSVDCDLGMVDAGAAEGLLELMSSSLHEGLGSPDTPLSAIARVTADALSDSADASPLTGEHVVDVVSVFDRAVAAGPGRVAVRDGEGEVSYARLAELSRAVAAGLVERGVSPGQRVGVCMDRDARLLAVIVGVLRAGAVYVPLDPEHPVSRLGYCARDAGVAAVVTDDSVSLGGHVEAPVIMVGELLASAGPVPAVQLVAESPAYVMYTSGSTGRPKGVTVCHGNVVWLLNAALPLVGATDRDVWSFFHSYAFDVSVWEMWGALASGGCVAVVPRDVARSPERFAGLLSRTGVTVLSQTPTAFTQISGHLDEISDLRMVVFGGERLSPSVVSGVDSRVRLVNMYGITETTVHVTFREVDRHMQGSPVGRGMPGTGVRVLDSFLQPVPVGVVGEIFVSGGGVVQGYHDRPGLTGERFVPDPFSGSGGRMYRSGDLARVLPDGSLDYVGRADAQVKVNGYRVEPAEIEFVVAGCPGVGECAVVVVPVGGADRVVAYVVPEGGVDLDVAGVREFAGSRLPSHMVPAYFVGVGALPLTVNGKLDRAALPVPGVDRVGVQNEFVAPRGGVEEVVCRVWESVLGVSPIGRNDNYFELGGDSIRAVQIIGALDEHHLRVDLDDFFRAPSVADLAELVRAAEQHDSPSPFELLTDDERSRLPEDAVDAYPMTATQVGMYLQAELNSEGNLYHNVNSVELWADLDPEAFTSAVAAAVRRHPILRTGFRVDGFRRFLQVVHSEARASVRLDDLRGLSRAEQETKIGHVVEEELNEPFDIAHPPLIRFRLLRRSEDSFQLVVTENHVILDGWSFTSLLVEIWEDHLTLAAGAAEPDRPKELRTAYADFVRLELEAVESGDARAYWAGEFADAAPTRYAEIVQTEDLPQRIARHTVPISEDLERSLRELAADLGVPLKSVLMAAHMRVLSALVGRADVVTGLVTNGRPERPDGDAVKGLFLNTVPVRGRLDGGSWADLVRDLYAAERGMLPHRRFPLGAITRELGVRDLFDCAFHFVEFHETKRLLSEQLLQGMAGSALSSENTHFRLLAAFSVHPPENRLGLVLAHDAATFGDRIGEVADAYHEALHRIAATPQESCARFRIGDALPVTLPSPRPALDDVVDVVSVFDRSVAAGPGRVAVRDGEGEVSYARLAELSRAVAAGLVERGVSPGQRVGVCMDRDARLLAVIVGVLRAGAVYVPLDPEHPVSRLGYCARDAGVAAVVTDDSVSLGGHVEAPLIMVGELLASAGPVPAVQLVAESPAYVMYTSGSTGRPKGVTVCHGNVVWLLNAALPLVGATDRDVWSFFHSYAFDFSVWEMWGALASGGCVAVVPRDVARSPERFAGLLSHTGVTVLSQTPTAFSHLLPYLPQAPEVRLVVFGGERLSPSVVSGVDSRVRLVNMYGITETTVHVTFREVDRHMQGSPVGRGMPGTGVRVLDSFLQPVPVGVVGEIFVSGGGVVQGYHDRPGLTGERFVPDPFSGSGGRMYRSGDLARVLPDGSLDYVGRADAQVKVNGYRVEPAEIEFVVAGCPGVGECAVVVVPVGGADRVVAYVVPEGGVDLDVAGVREFAGSRLPSHMVPAYFVGVGALPLTVNGKLDRAALPVPGVDRVGVQNEFVAPRGGVEEVVCRVWESVLGVSPIGRNDNYFELGGNSITAVEIADELSEALNVDVDFVDVYESATVVGLAERITTDLEDADV